MSYAERARRFLAEREKSERSEEREGTAVTDPIPVDSAVLTTARNILALSADELAAYRAEVAAAGPDDPCLAHDRAALALADRLRSEATT